MPLFRCNGQIHYFAHIPKCAGQSIEVYLEKRFGSLAFLDNGFFSPDTGARWTRTSPQHVTYSDLARLIPTEWIASSFACVRNPYARAVSAYNFYSLARQTLEWKDNIQDWFTKNCLNATRDSFLLDNHLLPQSNFIPEGAKIFKLEDGLNSIVDYLDDLENRTETDRVFPHINEQRLSHQGFEKRPVPAEFYSLLAQYYADDFHKLGYDTSDTPKLSFYIPIAPPQNVKRKKYKFSNPFNEIKDG